ncbi:hypothetical protein XELAEV_18024770mg [Xenopus laevis]|uniref:Uncharacterized protein n=1 Tax=Xenopus laevis TaxID=8355 RepID=A0A974CZI1_XENLA|nr:hypothetical protein XELAEV_18024770mg [Xenopus laevis]
MCNGWSIKTSKVGVNSKTPFVHVHFTLHLIQYRGCNLVQGTSTEGIMMKQNPLEIAFGLIQFCALHYLLH